MSANAEEMDVSDDARTGKEEETAPPRKDEAVDSLPTAESTKQDGKEMKGAPKEPSDAVVRNVKDIAATFGASQDLPSRKPTPPSTVTTAPGAAAAAAAAVADYSEPKKPSPKPPPPTAAPAAAPAAPVPRPRRPRPPLILLEDWDRTWEDQYERRKRRKVVPQTLPRFTIGRADDPIRLHAGPCACTGPCHLNDQCPCNHMGLFCTDACHYGNHRLCENAPEFGEARHRALVAAVQEGHRPLVKECCPCEPACEVTSCPCAMMGQRCRHVVTPRLCRNPAGVELARSCCPRHPPPAGFPPNIAVCVRRRKASTTTSTTTSNATEAPKAARIAQTKASNTSKASKASSAASKISSSKTKYGTTSVQKAWEAAELAADAYFGQNKGQPELDALYDVAANAAIHAKAELRLNTNERWWWRDSTPSAASPARKQQRKTEDDDDLECLESYSGIEVEKDVDTKKRQADITQVSQETLILRYAAMVLRQKACDLAARRLERQAAGPS